MNEPREIQPADADRINLIQISDTHLLGDPEERFDGVDTAATLAAVIEELRGLASPPDAILLTGDLAHEPEEAAYVRLRQLLGPLEAPVFCIPGNHDDPELMCRTLIDVDDGPFTDRSLVIGPWRVILLNTWKPGSHAGCLAKDELGFLEQQLSDAGGAHVLIALHHPPVSVDSPWMDAMGLENAGEFLAITDRYDSVRAVIWGHIHQQFEARRRGVRLLGVPSTCVQFTPGTDRYIRDNRAPGFRRLLLDAGGDVSSRIQRVRVPAETAP